MFLSFPKSWYLLNFLWVTGKLLLLVHHYVRENLDYIDRWGEWFFWKYLNICLDLIIFLPLIWLSAIFQPLLGISLQFLTSTPSNLLILIHLSFFFIKDFHHHINPIHMSGSFYLFHGILLFYSIFFSSVKFMINCGYQSVCGLSFIESIEVRCSICILHIDRNHEKCLFRAPFSVRLLILIIHIRI